MFPFEAFWEQQATLILLSLACFDMSLLIFTLVQIKKFRGLSAVDAPEKNQTLEIAKPTTLEVKAPRKAMHIKPIYVYICLFLTMASVTTYYFVNKSYKASKPVLSNGDEVLAINGKATDSGKPIDVIAKNVSAKDAPTVVLKVKSKDGTIVEKKVKAPTMPGVKKSK